ncbi:hypothetical protein CEXT_602601 [Caerostris extrusa]|uniref:Uncharacterized protein n=1 Tax=Caerostris extrusa TaxID=172846 RepID=A0AAV4XNP9_CAEEX|nr:hypothetical protein CEXT_602601 [Caerostris extrusa]
MTQYVYIPKRHRLNTSREKRRQQTADISHRCDAAFEFELHVWKEATAVVVSKVLGKKSHCRKGEIVDFVSLKYGQCLILQGTSQSFETFTPLSRRMSRVPTARQLSFKWLKVDNI